MANLYLLTSPLFMLLLFLIVLLYIGEAVLFYYRWPKRHFQVRARILTEGCSLLLLFVYLSLLYEIWDDQIWGLLYIHFMENVRVAVASFGLGVSLYGLCRGEWDNLAITGAAVFLLPCCDDLLPGSLLPALALLGGRILVLLPSAYRDSWQTITERSIQEAVDKLEEGVFISQERGEPVLVNQAMHQVVQQILGIHIRNGNILWHLLAYFPGYHTVRRERWGSALVFHLPGGQSWLLRRVYFQMPNQSGWQITATEVTELVKINQQIAETNRVIEERNTALRKLLRNLGQIQTQETTAAIKSKIHDLMGQRITMLQRLLNNQDDVTYAQIVPLVRNIFADIQDEMEIKPQQQLNDLFQTYRSLGIVIEMSGSLPADPELSREWVRLIREGLTNALSHGQATAVLIHLTQAGHSLRLSDNGIGCQPPLKEGTGLSAMRQRLEKMGVRLHFILQPHFIIIARAKEKKNDSLNDCR